MNKKFAFTLTEVLVTLSIIGVVSALTVPTLMNQYQRKIQATQIRKFANELDQGFEMQIIEEGKTKLSATNMWKKVATKGDLTDLRAFFNTRFKIIKTCNKTSGCFADTYRSIDGTKEENFNYSASATYVLANSAAIRIKAKLHVAGETDDEGNFTPTLDENGNYKILSANQAVMMWIDINGTEPPNIGGRDLFMIAIGNDGRIFDSCYTDNISFTCTPSAATCISSPMGSNCFGVLQENNWTMNY